MVWMEAATALILVFLAGVAAGVITTTLAVQSGKDRRE